MTAARKTARVALISVLIGLVLLLAFSPELRAALLFKLVPGYAKQVVTVQPLT